LKKSCSKLFLLLLSFRCRLLRLSGGLLLLLRSLNGFPAGCFRLRASLSFLLGL
jgi:hypothetical protein